MDIVNLAWAALMAAVAAATGAEYAKNSEYP